MDLIVGTFNHNILYTLTFTPPTPTTTTSASLTLINANPALAGHSWLAFSPSKQHLYATAWTQPQPSVAAYRVRAAGRQLDFLNAKRVAALAGYVCANATHVFSVGGPTGEVFRLEHDGSLGPLVQELDFVTGQGENVSEKRGDVPHGSFGGLRHGAHSCDLSPDGTKLFVADIGRNCVWSYRVKNTRLMDEAPLSACAKHASPREGDGPRHSWPHPNGQVLYVLQEHTSMVDVFAISSTASDGSGAAELKHLQAVKIIPADRDPHRYWADEVRLSTGPDAKAPRHLYASTRGLATETKGYVAVFRLRPDGTLAGEEAIQIWQTPTSGGLANAIEPAPWSKGQHEGVEYLALTDSQEGWVFMLEFDGKAIREVARLNLGKTDEGEVVGAATAVWLGEGSGLASVNFHR